MKSPQAPLNKGGLGGSFDVEKYERLMDRLEASIIKFHNLERTLRIDSEFFKKEYLIIVDILKQKNLKAITDVVHVFDGNHMKISDSFTESGIPYYRGQDIHSFFIEQASPIFIDRNTFELPYMKRSHLKQGDVLLSIVGTIGKISLVSKDLDATCNCKLAILRSKEIKPEFFATYLNSKFGQNQIKRFTRGAVQMGLILEDMDQLVIPEFSQTIKDKVTSVIQYAEKALIQSELTYQQAEELLLSELGLKDWQPTEENIAIKSFAKSFGKSKRLDAEHYQPKFDQLIQKLKEKVELIKLGKLLHTCQKGKQPQYFDEDEKIIEGYLVINSKQVQKGEVILTNSRFAPLPDGKEPLVIQKDDVLINGTGVGTIGRCATYFYEEEALPDTEVTVLRSDKLDSIYLSIYLNSMLGQLQVEKHLQGSSGIIRVYPKDIAQFWIWEAPEDIQKSIRDKVEESHHKREESKQLLEIAKTGVEKAIEENEELATGWINQQLEKLNINLSTIETNESY